jgi:hypothetical protein
VLPWAERSAGPSARKNSYFDFENGYGAEWRPRVQTCPVLSFRRPLFPHGRRVPGLSSSARHA